MFCCSPFILHFYHLWHKMYGFNIYVLYNANKYTLNSHFWIFSPVFSFLTNSRNKMLKLFNNLITFLSRHPSSSNSWKVKFISTSLSIYLTSFTRYAFFNLTSNSFDHEFLCTQSKQISLQYSFVGAHLTIDGMLLSNPI